MTPAFPSSWRLPVGLAALQGVAALILLLGAPVGGTSLWSFPLDDAWIHLSYARSFAERLAFEYNRGTLEAGMTSPLWVVLLGMVLRVVGTEAPVAVGKGLSLLFGVIGILGAARLGGALAGWAGAITAGIALVLLPEWTFAGLSGMETTAAGAVFVGIAIALVENRRTLGIILLALAPLIRPELLPVVAILGIALSRPDWHDRAGSLRRLAVTFFPVAITVLGWLGYHLFAVGRPLPNTFYVKASRVDLLESLQNLPTLWIFPITEGTQLGASFLLTAATLGYLAALRRSGNTRLLWASTFLFLAAVLAVAPSAAGGSNHYYRRYYDPALPLLAVFAGLGLLDPARQIQTAFRPVTLRIAALSLAVLLGSTLYRTWSITQSVYAVDTGAIDEVDVVTARWLAANVPANRSIAVFDAGATKWYLPEHQVIDVVGLNTSGAVRLSLEQVIERFQPDYLVFWSQPGIAALPIIEAEVFRVSIENKGPLPSNEMSVWKLRSRDAAPNLQAR